MDKIIEWYNTGAIVTLQVTVGNAFSIDTILDIDNISIYDNVVNIMVGGMNVDLCVTDFTEDGDSLVYTEGNVSISLTT